MCDRFDRRGGERGKSADPNRGGTSLAVGWSMEARRGASSAAGPVQACGWPVLGWSGCGPPVPPRSVAGEAVSSEKAVYPLLVFPAFLGSELFTVLGCSRRAIDHRYRSSMPRAAWRQPPAPELCGPSGELYLPSPVAYAWP